MGIKQGEHQRNNFKTKAEKITYDKKQKAQPKKYKIKLVVLSHSETDPLRMKLSLELGSIKGIQTLENNWTNTKKTSVL